MIEPDELLDFALRALASDDTSETHARRAISAAYYALLHSIAAAGGSLFRGSPAQQQRVAPAYNHGALIRAARRVSSTPARGAAATGSADLRAVARIVIDLHQAREAADYDLLCPVQWGEAARLIWAALDGCHLFQLIRGEAEVTDFLLEPLFPERNRG